MAGVTSSVPLAVGGSLPAPEDEELDWAGSTSGADRAYGRGSPTKESVQLEPEGSMTTAACWVAETCQKQGRTGDDAMHCGVVAVEYSVVPGSEGRNLMEGLAWAKGFAHQSSWLGGAEPNALHPSPRPLTLVPAAATVADPDSSPAADVTTGALPPPTVVPCTTGQMTGGYGREGQQRSQGTWHA